MCQKLFKITAFDKSTKKQIEFHQINTGGFKLANRIAEELVTTETGEKDITRYAEVKNAQNKLLRKVEY